MVTLPTVGTSKPFKFPIFSPPKKANAPPTGCSLLKIKINAKIQDTEKYKYHIFLIKRSA